MSRLLKGLMLGLCLLIGGSALAATVAIDIDTSKPQRYVVLITVAADGTITFTPIPIVATLKGDGPIDPPPPPTGTLEQRLKAHKEVVKSELAKVPDTPDKAQTIIALETLYRNVAGLPVPSRADLSSGTDTIFLALRLTAPWEVWKGNISRSLVQFASLEDAKKAWLATADALGGK